MYGNRSNLSVVIEIFNIDNAPNNPDDDRIKLYTPLDPHSSEILGCWKGIRVSYTDRADLSEIVC